MFLHLEKLKSFLSATNDFLLEEPIRPKIWKILSVISVEVSGIWLSFWVFLPIISQILIMKTGGSYESIATTAGFMVTLLFGAINAIFFIIKGFLNEFEKNIKFSRYLVMVSLLTMPLCKLLTWLVWYGPLKNFNPQIENEK